MKQEIPKYRWVSFIWKKWRASLSKDRWIPEEWKVIPIKFLEKSFGETDIILQKFL